MRPLTFYVGLNFCVAGKFGASAAFTLIYLYTAEMFPTTVRATALGVCSMGARVGGILAPQVVLYLPTVAPKESPMAVMGVCSLVGAFLSVFLPETLGSHTVQSISDVLALSQNTKPFFAYWSSQTLKTHLQKLNKLPETNRGGGEECTT